MVQVEGLPFFDQKKQTVAATGNSPLTHDTQELIEEPPQSDSDVLPVSSYLQKQFSFSVSLSYVCVKRNKLPLVLMPTWLK